MILISRKISVIAGALSYISGLETTRGSSQKDMGYVRLVASTASPVMYIVPVS